jgi:hypothetical protein
MAHRWHKDSPDGEPRAPTGFVIKPDRTIAVSQYSSGPIGQLVWQDVLGLDRSTRQEAGEVTGQCWAPIRCRSRLPRLCSGARRPSRGGLRPLSELCRHPLGAPLSEATRRHPTHPCRHPRPAMYSRPLRRVLSHSSRARVKEVWRRDRPPLPLRPATGVVADGARQ